jgi:hypothetical protein
MTLPGFTAEVGLYRPNRAYGKSIGHQAAPGDHTYRSDRMIMMQRVGGPHGPIGLPGQDCVSACMHNCERTGDWWCVADCISTCRGLPGGLRL